jgi:WD40 repeat protein
MTDQELDRLLRAWYGAEFDEAASAPIGLRAAVAAIPRTLPRRARWWGRSRGFTLLAAAALLLVGGAVATGSGLLRLPSPVTPQPVPSLLVLSPAPPAEVSPSPVPSLVAAARPGALIAYIQSTQKADKGNNCGYNADPTCPIPRLWIVGSDGSRPHELLPDGLYGQTLMAWTPDGSRLLFAERGQLYLTDVAGSGPQPVDTGCVAPCEGVGDAAFSSDGTRLVFVRSVTDASGSSGASVIAEMDLATGRVEELSSTYPAGGALPGWSPDGRQIAFFRYGDKDLGGPIKPTKAAVFVVDADGRNLHQVSPTTIAAQFAGWSPDGSRLVFTSPGAGAADIYTVRPDGTDLRRLTTDERSYAATWTPDARILFLRGFGTDGTADAPALWTMDADGAHPAELVANVSTGGQDPMWTYGPAWQPVGGPAVISPPWTASAATPVGPPPPTPAATPSPALSSGFSPTGSISGGADDATTDTATVLVDGRVLTTTTCDTTVQLYDPATGTFTPTGSLAEVRSGKTATLLRDGRVLIVGGFNCSDGGQAGGAASAELYDPATGTFTATGSMGASRASHTATLLADGRVLVTGGKTADSPADSLGIMLASYRTAATGESNVLASAEVYDPATGTFSPTGSMRYFRDGHTATLLRDGRVLVVGGGGEGYDSRTEVELYDPATGAFSDAGPLKHGRWLQTATLLDDGRVLIAGGRSPEGSTYASTELYDPATGRFSPAGSMHASRQQHSATLLPNGRVLVTGGYKSDGSTWDVLSAAELYDPETQKFTPAGSMGAARMQHVAALLGNGQVLIAGGLGIGTQGLVPLRSAVLYQP